VRIGKRTYCYFSGCGIQPYGFLLVSYGENAAHEDEMEGIIGRVRELRES
jgi:hypothetical protein